MAPFDQALTAEQRGIREKVREPVRLDDVLETRRVRALGQPDTSWLDAGPAARRARSDRELRVYRRGIKQRQIAVRGARRKDLDVARTREVGEGADDIATEPSYVGVTVRTEERCIEHRERAACRVAVAPETLRVLIGALDLIVAVLDEAMVDVGVGQLLEQWRRESDRHAIADAVVA